MIFFGFVFEGLCVFLRLKILFVPVEVSLYTTPQPPTGSQMPSRCLWEMAHWLDLTFSCMINASYTWMDLPLDFTFYSLMLYFSLCFTYPLFLLQLVEKDLLISEGSLFLLYTSVSNIFFSPLSEHISQPQNVRLGLVSYTKRPVHLFELHHIYRLI